VLDFAAERFIEEVVRPSLDVERGEPRIREVFSRWLRWAQAHPRRSGCLFVAAAAELDDRSGPARDRVVLAQRDWLAFLARAAQLAIREGHFHKAADPNQFAYELYSLMLGYHHAARLLEDPAAEVRARNGFERLVAMARARPLS
jgi:hypothetical protein